MKRSRWNSVVILAAILASVPALYPQAQKDTGQPAASQSDVNELSNARELFETNHLDEAKSICDRLVDKGGNIGDQARQLEEKIRTRSASMQDFEQAVALINRGECPPALDLLKKIRQSDPGYAVKNVNAQESRCQSASPAPGPGPSLDSGKKLLRDGKYRQALAYFQSQLAAYPNSQELQDLMATTKRFEDDRKKTSEAEVKQADRDRAAHDALLMDAIGEFYKGNLSHADQLLEQYLSQPGGDDARAYFFRGAVACTEYFLTGAKDDQKEALARDWFAKARQADARFSPPGDYVSPKIVKIYQESGAGS